MVHYSPFDSEIFESEERSSQLNFQFKQLKRRSLKKVFAKQMQDMQHCVTSHEKRKTFLLSRTAYKVHSYGLQSFQHSTVMEGNQN